MSGFPAHAVRGTMKLKITRRRFLAGSIAVGIGAFADMRFVEPRWLRVAHVDAALPAGRLANPIRILHISDIHASRHVPVEFVKKAIELGFDMVHFDGSELPFEENLKASIQLVELAHQKGALIEVEFQKIQRSSQAYLEETAEEVQIKGTFTDPEEAEKIIAQTKADVLAVSVGNLHGVYKTPEEINLLLLEDLKKRLPCYMSLHGGSGINEDQVRKATKSGIVKINVNTDLRLAYRKTLENVLKGSDEVKVYKIMPPVIGAIQKVVEEKIELFGSQGKAGGEKPVPETNSQEESPEEEVEAGFQKITDLVDDEA